jgi:hypothetical protein
MLSARLNPVATSVVGTARSEHERLYICLFIVADTAATEVMSVNCSRTINAPGCAYAHTYMD